MRRQQAAAAVPLLLAALLLASGAAAKPDAAAVLPADSFLNADGLPLLMPTNRTTDGRRWLFELPRDPVGTLVMLHRCGRNAEDYWPPSEVCPQCIGLPEGVSIAKQALARGYALVALNSRDRRVGAGARCWSWADDAVFVKETVEAFRKENGLGNKPLFFTGCSSGGSLALRLPGLMRIDGVMSVAIGLEEDAFPLSSPKQEFPYPPSALVHFSADKNTDAKVKGMLATMQRKGVPGVEQLVGEKPITPNFFSTRDPMISLALSQKLHAAFKDELQILNETDFLIPEKVDGQAPWDALLRDKLPGWLQELSAQQLALKNGSTLAQAQRALGAAGDAPLRIQEVSADAAAAAEAATNAEDSNPNFSDSDGVSSASGGDDPYLSAKLLDQHIKEEIGLAWGRHANDGDYTTAALVWLERCGKANYPNIAARWVSASPASLSPVRKLPGGEVLSAWRACSAEAGQPQPASAGAAGGGKRTGNKPDAKDSAPEAASVMGGTSGSERLSVRLAATAVVAACAAAALVLL